MMSRLRGAAVWTIAMVFAMSVAMVAGQGKKAPRTALRPDGQPDIQGHWIQRGLSVPTYSLEDGPPAEHSAASGLTHQLNRPSAIVDPADGRIPYQPWAAAQRQLVIDGHLELKLRSHMDPQDRCFLGVASRFFSVGNIQILQSPGYVVLLNDWLHAFRIVPIDGRPHLGESIKLWQGDSRGRWEGGTLVIETTGSNDKTWFDKMGSFHSDTMRITEQLQRVDATTLSYRATIDDPRVFTRPWTIGLTLKTVEDSGTFELIEQACYEGDVFGRETFATLKDK